MASISSSPSGSNVATASKSAGQSRVSEGSTVVAMRCDSANRSRRVVSDGSSNGRYHVVYVRSARLAHGPRAIALMPIAPTPRAIVAARSGR